MGYFLNKQLEEIRPIFLHDQGLINQDYETTQHIEGTKLQPLIL